MSVMINQLRTEVVPDAPGQRSTPAAATPGPTAGSVEAWQDAQRRAERVRCRTAARDFED